nr:putative reverse transcriptase domain-containing protein [Tanacetum cinerariifolium]
MRILFLHLVLALPSNSGSCLEFQQKFTIGMWLCFSRLTSRSMISTTLLSITCCLNTLLDLDDLSHGFVNISGPVSRVSPTSAQQTGNRHFWPYSASNGAALILVWSDCLKLKDQNRGNKTGNKNRICETKGKAYVLGGGDTNPDSNVITSTFLVNNHYASVLFDSGVDRSFVSTTFSTLLDIIPVTLDVSYVIELADMRVFETNIILRGCMLGLLGHPFNIDLMPVELGSFDIIIGMDWLANHHAVIVCDEKIVQITYGDEVLIFQGDRNGKGKKSKLSILSSPKTQKYIKKGFLIFLAQVMKKETKDKSGEKRTEDVSTVRDFPEVFPEDLHGLPPTRQVEF